MVNVATQETHPPLQTLVVYAEDKPGVINRISSLFRRSDFNIESLTTGKTLKSEVARLTIVMRGDSATTRRFEASLYKLVNILRVVNMTDLPSVESEIALIKVSSNAKTRQDILAINEEFHSQVVDLGTAAIILEVTGTPEKIDSMIGVLEQFGIIEVARTGLVAMTRSSEGIPVDSEPVSETPTPGSNQSHS
jgi:acetolactate synthase-1/3 small subunit